MAGLLEALARKLVLDLRGAGRAFLAHLVDRALHGVAIEIAQGRGSLVHPSAVPPAAT